MEREGIQTNGKTLHLSDYFVLVAYFVGVMAVGFWSSRKLKGSSVKAYFLANRNMHWIPVGASLYATTVGSGSFVGLAGAGANSGLGIAAIEIHSMYILLILGWFFVPVYISSGVNTMPEYMMKRFGGQRIHIYLSVLSLILFIFVGVSVDLYSGALFIKQALGLNMYISVVILVGMAAILTINGGLTAVLWTDLVQTVIMFIGAIFLMILSLVEVGGYENLFDSFALRAEPTDPQYIGFKNNCNPLNQTCISCSAVTKYYKNLIRPPTDPEMPFTGIVFGLTISSVWFWCTNQLTVQRVLSAKNVSHAKAGCSFCSFLKVFSVFLIVLTGMTARVLWPNEIGCSNPDKCQQICGSKSGCSNLAYPLLVLRLMPRGATGLMLSVMIAALMSSLTSQFNSASTIFTLDIYTKIRKNASETQLVIIGRIFVLIVMSTSILWIPIIQASSESQLFHYIQSIMSFLAPPVCSVYVLGIFCARINEKGAFWSLMVGMVIGLVRFTTEFLYSAPSCASSVVDNRPLILKMHYWHFGTILFIITAIVAIVISLLTDPIDENKLYRLTYSTRFSQQIRSDMDPKRSPEMVHTFSKSKRNLDSNENDLKHEFVSNNYGADYEKNQMNDKNYLSNKAEEAVKSADSVKETSNWQSVNNRFAIIVIAFASFIWVFYA